MSGVRFPLVKKGLWLIIAATILQIAASIFASINYQGFVVASDIIFIVSSVLDLVGFIMCALDNASGFKAAVFVIVFAIILEALSLLFASLGGQAAILATISSWFRFARPLFSLLVVLLFVSGCREVVDSESARRFCQFTLLVLFVVIIVELVFGIIGRINPAQFETPVAIVVGIAEAVFNVVYFILLVKTYRHTK